MLRNIDRLAARAAKLGVPLRPHMKTAKSVDVARCLGSGRDLPVTVSTLAEAEALFAAGYGDILYAVGIAPHKLPRVKALCDRGCDLTVILDNLDQAHAVAQAARDIHRLCGLHVGSQEDAELCGPRRQPIDVAQHPGFVEQKGRRFQIEVGGLFRHGDAPERRMDGVYFLAGVQHIHELGRPRL
jgi:hypothetical protein